LTEKKINSTKLNRLKTERPHLKVGDFAERVQGMGLFMFFSSPQPSPKEREMKLDFVIAFYFFNLNTPNCKLKYCKLILPAHSLYLKPFFV
jgi:hypothetical protein